MMQRFFLKRSIVALMLASVAGCTAAPRQRPVKGGDVSEGAGSITQARKFLQGRWSLESFEVFPPGKAPITLNGSGMLNYDEFGNLRVEIRADDQSAQLLRAAGIDIQDGKISSDGRTVVDMQNRTLSYILAGQAVGDPGAGPLSPSRLRYWEVKGDLLFLSTKDAAGTTLSMARWKKMP